VIRPHCFPRPTVSGSNPNPIKIRRLREDELQPASRIFREAFAANIGMADPSRFAPGADPIGFRWRADPEGVFAATRGAELVGSIVATRWGSVGIFGPLSVRPDAWNGGVGKQLVAAAVEWLERSGCPDLVLYTRAGSIKHLGLYQRFGYWPRFPIAITEKALDSPRAERSGWRLLSEVADTDRTAFIAASLDLTAQLHPGLDLRREIVALASHAAGDTVLIAGAQLDGFALCHVGAGSEAETGAACLKFAAARTGRGAEQRFISLLAACEAFAATRGARALVAGTNLARTGAWRVLASHGYRTTTLGVAMHRPNRSVYDRPGAYAIDEWR